MITCDSGWDYLVEIGYCYKIVKERKNYWNSEKACASEGGHLASIHSHEEMRQIRSMSAIFPKH